MAGRLSAEYDAFLGGDFLVLGRKSASAIVVAKQMVDYRGFLDEEKLAGILAKACLTEKWSNFKAKYVEDRSL